MVANGVVAEPPGGTVTFAEAVVAAPFAVVGVVVLLLLDDVPRPHDANNAAANTPEAAIVAERTTEIGIPLAYDAASTELCHFASPSRRRGNKTGMRIVGSRVDRLSERSESEPKARQQNRDAYRR
jgi:hypothetical protein